MGAASNASYAFTIPAPKAPTAIFTENFDNAIPANTPNSSTPAGVQALNLDEYVSANLDTSGNPVRYTATGKAVATDINVPFWLNKNFCNGMRLNSTSPIPTGTLSGEYTAGFNTYCTQPSKLNVAWPALQALADALGRLTGAPNSAANHAIAAYTTEAVNRTNGNAPLTELQMVQPVAIPPGGRFVTFSVAVAATSCNADPKRDPNISFYFIKDVAGDTTTLNSANTNLIKLNNTPANPCTATNAVSYNINSKAIKAAQMSGDKATFINDDHVAMLFANETSNTNGNDGAFDNIQVLDVTPQLYKSFADTSIANGGTTTLTFTIVNTNEFGEKAGWSFKDYLPTGMQVAAAPKLQATCSKDPAYNSAAFTADAHPMSPSAGSTSVELTGTLGAGTSSCQISVDVTSTLPSPLASAQTLTNGVANAPAGSDGSVTTTGLIPPTPVSVQVLPSADMSASSATTQTVSKGTPVTVNTSCTNNGPDVALAATCSVSGVPTDATNVSTTCTPSSAAATLKPTESISCKTTFTPQTPGVVTLTTKAATTSKDTNSLNDAKDSLVNVRPLADMQAVAPSTATTKSGVPVTIKTSCTNIGPDVAEAANCEVRNAPAGAITQCKPTPLPLATLPVAQSISCETTFTPTATGTITLLTVASSTTPDPVPSNNSALTVVTVAAKTADMQAEAPSTITTTPNVEVKLMSTCKNDGPDEAINASCTVSGAPTGATTVCTPASPVSTLAVGASISCTTTFTPLDASAITISTNAASDTPDPKPENNVAKTSNPSVPAAVPSLSDWALALLATLLAGFTALCLRRQRKRG